MVVFHLSVNSRDKDKSDHNLAYPLLKYTRNNNNLDENVGNTTV